MAGEQTNPTLVDDGPLTSTSPSEHSPLLHRDVVDTDHEVAAVDHGASTSNSSSSEEEGWRSRTVASGIQTTLSRASILRILCILLIAVFVTNADGSLVMATHPIISSEFHALESSTWLFTAYGLAGSAAQSSLAKLSDIFGRKPVVLSCYTLFAVGCVIVGLGQSMSMVIVGRVISGAVGGSLSLLVSIIITDLVPIREIAAWRSYANVVATTGRSVGGPLGGWLTDIVGWRWSFLGQAPPLLVAIFLCWLYIPGNIGVHAKQQAPEQENPKLNTKFSRVDFPGAILLALLILALLTPLELGGVKLPWTHPLVISLFGAAAVLLAAFIYVEKYWAKEPVIPMDLFTQRDAVASFAIMGLQSTAQIGLMFCVPLYFQVTQRVSNTEAGAHLIPAVAGNAVAGIISGYLINKSGRYKWLIYFATLTASFSYALLLWRWTGNTNWLEALYIAPGGFGTGMVMNAIFVALQASIDKSHIAAAVSTLYLSASIGAIVGLASMGAVLQAVLRTTLAVRLADLGMDDVQMAEIIAKAVSNVEYVLKTEGKVAEAITASYVDGLWYTHGISLACSLAAFCITCFLSERKI